MSELASLTFKKVSEIDRLGWKLAGAPEGPLVPFVGFVGADLVTVAVSAEDIVSLLKVKAAESLHQSRTFH